MAEPARAVAPQRTIDRTALLDSLFFIASGGAAMRDATGPLVRARSLVVRLRERCAARIAIGGSCDCGMHRGQVRP